MIGVSEQLSEAVKRTLAQPSVSEPSPIVGVDRHFCSFEKDKVNTDLYKQLFALDIDGREAMVYIRL